MEENNTTNREIMMKKEAFRNIITHTYRFGHNALSNPDKVVGICLGSLSEQETLIVKNAIPITHGNNLIINENQQIKTIVSQMKEKYDSKELEVVGVYISHLEGEKYLNEDDIKNILFIQKEIDLLGVYIILNRDLTIRDKNFGFKVYKLNDPSQGMESDTSELILEIEEPQSLNVFKWVQKFVEDYQKKKPTLIKEVMETPQNEEKVLQEIPIEAPEASEDAFTESTFQQINSALEKNMEKIFEQQLNRWSQDLKDTILTSNEQLLNTIIQIKDNIPIGINMIHKQVQGLINESLESFKITIYRHIKEIQDIDELFMEINTIFDDALKSIEKTINKNISENYNNLRKGIKELNENGVNVISQNSQIVEKSSNFQNLTNSIKDTIRMRFSKLNESLEEKMKELKEPQLSNLEELQREIIRINETELQKVQNKLNELRKLTDNIKDI